ncbi:Gfo/Idh/MocA family protein [Propionibacteriaceae bacterium Y2011]
MSGGSLRVGIIGAGVISKQYLTNLSSFPDVDVRAIGDLVVDAAASRAEEFGVAKYGDVDAVLGDPEIELVVNLTIPAAHATVGEAVVGAGKHLWNEKPLTPDRESAARLLAAAEAAGVRVGSAPDTMLGRGWQGVRRAVERGDIGTPLTAQVLFQSPGPNMWHPNPDFLFQSGGGPLLDIGPYYLTALSQVLGPVSGVVSVGSKAFEQRPIGQGPRAGESFDVTVPTHVGALLRYRDGAVAQTVFSFDSAVKRTVIEISGTEGTLIAPDPNQFAGEVKVLKMHETEPQVVDSSEGVPGRGTGVLDMARSIRAGVPHYASGEMGQHILDVMLSIEAGVDGSVQQITTSAEKPTLLPEDFDPTVATL